MKYLEDSIVSAVEYAVETVAKIMHGSFGKYYSYLFYYQMFALQRKYGLAIVFMNKITT